MIVSEWLRKPPVQACPINYGKAIVPKSAIVMDPLENETEWIR